MTDRLLREEFSLKSKNVLRLLVLKGKLTVRK